MSPLRRIAATAFAGTLLALSGGAAWAHVEVTPTVVQRAEFPTFTFRVPNERAGVVVNKVQIFFPTDAIMPTILVQPPPGWTWEVARGLPGRPLGVASVTFKGGEIPKGQFATFGVEAGAVPEDADQLVFPTHLTFSDGDVAKFDQPWPEGAPEPQAPAPRVRVVGDATSAVAGDVDGARQLGLIGVGVGALGLAVGAAALFYALRLRRRLRPAEATD